QGGVQVGEGDGGAVQAQPVVAVHGQGDGLGSGPGTQVAVRKLHAGAVHGLDLPGHHEKDQQQEDDIDHRDDVVVPAGAPGGLQVHPHGRGSGGARGLPRESRSNPRAWRRARADTRVWTLASGAGRRISGSSAARFALMAASSGKISPSTGWRAPSAPSSSCRGAVAGAAALATGADRSNCLSRVKDEVSMKNISRMKTTSIRAVRPRV